MQDNSYLRLVVLIVDDDPAVARRVVRGIHQETKMGSIFAENLSKAAEYLKDPRLQFDAIICDIYFQERAQAPESGLRDGFDLLEIARDVRPNIARYILSVDADLSHNVEQAMLRGIKVAGWFSKLHQVCVDPPWVQVEKDLSTSIPPVDQSKGTGSAHSTFAFDVFLAHSSPEKPLVEQLAYRLKLLKLKPWLDIWNVRPGCLFQEEIEAAIPMTKAIAVFYGKSGIGPWENLELRLAITQFVKRKLPVIPVLLPGAPQDPEWPLFLREFGSVTFRTEDDKEAFDRLVWGISGERE